MEIICKFIEVQNEIDGLSPGAYLSILTDKNSKQIYVEYNEFKRRYQEAASLEKPQNEEPDATSDAKQLESDNAIKVNQFEQVVSYIFEKIGFTQLGDDNEFIVKSEWSEFLELPWEQVLGNKFFVIRVFPNGGSVKKEFDPRQIKNLVILMSHAYKGISRKSLERVMKDEVKAVYSIFADENHSSFNIQQILISKHTSKDSLTKIPLDGFNLLHLIAHGINDGCIALEAASDYKSPDYLSPTSFLDYFKEGQLDLIFLSNCYSGGGVENNKSLAFQFVEKGFALYSIGYHKGVGEDDAKRFAETFYKNLVSGGRIEEVYKKSLSEYYRIVTNSNYIPFLFVRD